MTDPGAEPFRLYALRYAHRDARRGEHFYGQDPCGDEPMPIAYYVWLAVSGQAVVVVDAGFTAETARRRGRAYVASPAATMAALGVDASDVAHVVLTHLHYDHTGDVATYGRAGFVVQEREMAFWTGRDASRGAGPHLVERPDIAFLVDANFDGRIRWVDGDAEVVPGITVHLVGGHTAGMQIVRVLTADGYAVLASDASHFYANIDEDRPYSIVHTLPAMHRAFDTIRDLADDPRLIVAGHDPAVLERYPPAGEGLAGLAVRIGVSRRVVVIVGGGNAGLCAAISAREAGAEVTVLEVAPQELAGGDTAFTAGLMRTAFRGVEDIRALVPDLTDDEVATTDFGNYPEERFLADLGRVTEYRCDPDLAETLVSASHGTLAWMRDHGVRFAPAYGRQAYKIDGRFVFWGGVVVEVVGGGPGLVAGLTAEAARMGVVIRYDARASALLHDDHGVHGVRARIDGTSGPLDADAVVLAAGGFQADAAWRACYLGPGWDLAKVRGTRFNTGDGIRMALEAGASPAGNWSGCHAVSWDRNAPEFGDLDVGDGFQKHSYPLGIMVNARGERFLDEGADFRNFTYAKYGRVVLAQPGQFAWQVFDAQVAHLLRHEYRIRQVTRVAAGSLEELATRMEGVDPGGFLRTSTRYNAAVRRDVAFDPNVLDGRGTDGLDPPKSNWANPLEVPPFEAFAVTCGITFTGGVRIDAGARVLDMAGRPIPGLYACGEMGAGIFYFNYPGGSGLTTGSVFGRAAGRHAASP